jgi:N-acetylglucosamine kinase-like BadF-type ATPase
VIGLGIDAGASSARWLLLDEHDRELGRGSTGPITGHLFTAKERQETFHHLDTAMAEALAIARPDAVVAGITGLHGGTEAKEILTQRIAETLELDPRSIALEDDMYVAYRNAFEPGEGVLLYAGTGSVAYHLRRDGSIVRAGGYGYLIDDAGAGFWIGQMGIRQTMRWLDELGHPAERPLATLIYDSLSARDWPGIMARVYGEGRSRVASLAPAVAAAAQAGDEAAQAILEQAGRALAQLASAVLGRTPNGLPVAFCGGVTRCGPILSRALEEALPARTELRVITTEPVLAAARLALRKTA